MLDAALTAFGTRGFEATSLDAIAGELGVRKQTILYYFPSKAELLRGVILYATAELAEVLSHAASRRRAAAPPRHRRQRVPGRRPPAGAHRAAS